MYSNYTIVERGPIGAAGIIKIISVISDFSRRTNSRLIVIIINISSGISSSSSNSCSPIIVGSKAGAKRRTIGDFGISGAERVVGERVRFVVVAVEPGVVEIARSVGGFFRARAGGGRVGELRKRVETVGGFVGVKIGRCWNGCERIGAETGRGCGRGSECARPVHVVVGLGRRCARVRKRR